MTSIGIDPGVGGGIAVLDPGGSVVAAERMPETERDLFDMLGLYTLRSYALLERVRSSPQMGVVSAFTFGRGYGGLRMALVAHGIPFSEVLPAAWQKAMDCRTKGDKNVSKRRAQELFPAIRVTHATADALLLAEHCRRTRIEANW